MKNSPIDPLAAQDITVQVGKVLRRLGRPEPPLDLRDVRELLKLDRQFFSSTNTGPLQEFISKMKVGAKQIVMRARLLFLTSYERRASRPYGFLTENVS